MAELHNHGSRSLIQRSVRQLAAHYFAASSFNRDRLPPSATAELLESTFVLPCAMTLIIDYNISHLHDEGVTPDSYSPNWDRLLALFPSLGDILEAVTAESLESVAIAWERFTQDRVTLIRNGMWESDAPSDVHITPVGDIHGPNQTVFKVSYAGCRAPLYYKPHRGDKDAELRAAAELLSGLFSTCLQTPRALDRPDYQWQTHIERQEGAIEPELIGHLLGFAYATSFTDLHPGNVLKTPSGLAIIDTESFLSPQEAFDADQRTRVARVAEIERDSFASLCILPLRVGGDIGIPGANWGLWGGYPDDTSGTPHTHMVRRGAQLILERETHLSDGEIEQKRSQNQQIVNEYPSLIESFCSALSSILDHREALGRLVAEHVTPTRCIFRPTQFYTDILERSYHPTLLAKPRGREIYIEQQLRDSEKAKSTSLEFVIREIDDLVAGRIPHFECSPQGGEYLGFSMESVASVVDRRLDLATTTGSMGRLKESIRMSTLAFLAPNEHPFQVSLPACLTTPHG